MCYVGSDHPESLKLSLEEATPGIVTEYIRMFDSDASLRMYE